MGGKCPRGADHYWGTGWVLISGWLSNCTIHYSFSLVLFLSSPVLFVTRAIIVFTIIVSSDCILKFSVVYIVQCSVVYIESILA